MEKSIENLSNRGGVYLILNVIDCKVYVGQAEKFNNRDHIYELKHGRDSCNLQKDYNDTEKEFVYFVVVDGGEVPEKNDLLWYETLYMALMQDLGFELYNVNISEWNPTAGDLENPDEEYNRAKEAVTSDFKPHFDCTPEELINKGLEGRKEALEYYASQR